MFIIFSLQSVYTNSHAKISWRSANFYEHQKAKCQTGRQSSPDRIKKKFLQQPNHKPELFRMKKNYENRSIFKSYCLIHLKICVQEKLKVSNKLYIFTVLKVLESDVFLWIRYKYCYNFLKRSFTSLNFNANSLNNLQDV